MPVGRRPFIMLLLFVLVLSAACGGSNPPEPDSLASGLTHTLEQTAVSATPQIFVIPIETEKRLISTDVIPQPNCDGTAEVSDTIEREHSVLRTLELGSGITVDAEGRAGIPGVGEVAVGVAVATYYQVGYGTTDTITRSVTVAAKEGTHIEHTIRQFEIWEKGDLLVVSGSLSQQIPYSFRKDFSIEKLPPANIGCPATPTTEGNDPQPPPTVLVEPSTVGSSETVSATTAVLPPPTAESTNGVQETAFSVDVPVKSEQGESWTAPATGTYLISVESGAYNPWPSDSDCAGCWRTRVNAYVGCEIKRELSPGQSEMAEPVDPSFTLGNFTNMDTLQAAESFAISMPPSTVTLNQGDCVRFVAIDGVSTLTPFSAYRDNRGNSEDNPKMTLRITSP